MSMKPIQIKEPQLYEVKALAFLEDGETLAAGGALRGPGQAVLHQLGGERRRMVLVSDDPSRVSNADDHRVRCLAACASRRMLAAGVLVDQPGSPPRTFALLLDAGGTFVGVLGPCESLRDSGVARGVGGIAWLGDGVVFTASAPDDAFGDVLYRYSLDGQRSWMLPLHCRDPFTPPPLVAVGERVMVSLNSDRGVILVDKEGNTEPVLARGGGRLFAANADGSRFALASNKVTVWIRGQGGYQRVPRPITPDPRFRMDAVAMSAEGAVACALGTHVYIYNREGDEVRHITRAGLREIYSLCFWGEKWLAVGSSQRIDVHETGLV